MKIKKKTTCCSDSSDTTCCPPAETKYQVPVLDKPYITGAIETKIGEIPRVPATLSRADKRGSIKVRLDIGRAGYIVEPGLYAVGNPDSQSIVLVSANYKLSFDTLRKELGAVNAWILVLDTRGINVWCAAGKGTFGTDELVHRIETSGIKEIVGHKRLIVPQLGAVGVSAHKVKQQTGFTVTYGPVRASDLPAYLETGNKTTPAMREMRFTLYDRFQVMPVELVQGVRYLFYAAILYYAIAILTGGDRGIQWSAGILPIINLTMAYLAGTVMGPLLLPWLPGRSFSMKGAGAGALVFVIPFFTTLAGSRVPEMAAWLLVFTAAASFFTMNFTGSSTYTSLSGVKKEMRIAVPMQAAAGVIGTLLWVSGRFQFI